MIERQVTVSLLGVVANVLAATSKKASLNSSVFLRYFSTRNIVSSTETDINRWLAKAWTANDRLSVIWKSDLTDKMKRNFF